MDDQKPSDNVIKQVTQNPLDPVRRRKMNDLKMDLARVIQRHDAQPDVAITAMLNIMGSIIGTQMTPEDRTIWTQQVVQHLPAYVEAFRVKEKKL